MLADVRRFVGGVAIVLVAAALLTFYLVRGTFALAGRDVCASTLLAERAAPGGRLVAVVYRPRCAAWAGFPTLRVAVLAPPGRRIPPGDVVLAADARRFRGHMASAVRAVWTDSNTVRIEYDPGLRILRRVPQHAGVTVTFAPFASADSAAP